MPIVPLFGSNVRGKSATITAERRLNFYAEPYVQGNEPYKKEADKTPRAMIGRFGLTRVAYASPISSNVGAIGGPIRGISEQYSFVSAGVTLDFVSLVHGNMLETYSPGSGLVAGTFGGTGLRTTSGPVKFCFNGTQLLYVDGRTGYVANTITGVITYLEDTPAQFFPAGATTCCFIGGRMVVNDPSAIGQFRWSNTYNALLWNALDFATAETSADPLVAVFESLGELILIGRDTLEFWAPTGGTDIFRRIGGSGVDWGCLARNSVDKVNGGWAMLARARSGGEKQVVFVQGHVVTPISSPDVTFDINTSVSPDSATGFGYVIGGHSFYQLNLPETTWVYDFTSHEWQEFGTDGGRHAVDRIQACFGFLLGGDYRDGRMYKLDLGNFTDDGNIIVGEVTSKHVLSDYERLTIAEAFVEFEAGVGLISGQGSNPQAMLTWSHDGGRTYGNEAWASIGAMGGYKARAVWRLLGRARDTTIKLRITDPVKRVITNAAMRIA